MRRRRIQWNVSLFSGYDLTTVKVNMSSTPLGQANLHKGIETLESVEWIWHSWERENIPKP